MWERQQRKTLVACCVFSQSQYCNLHPSIWQWQEGRQRHNQFQLTSNDPDHPAVMTDSPAAKPFAMCSWVWWWWWYFALFSLFFYLSCLNSGIQLIPNCMCHLHVDLSHFGSTKPTRQVYCSSQTLAPVSADVLSNPHCRGAKLRKRTTQHN